MAMYSAQSREQVRFVPCGVQPAQAASDSFKAVPARPAARSGRCRGMAVPVDAGGQGSVEMLVDERGEQESPSLVVMVLMSVLRSQCRLNAAACAAGRPCVNPSSGCWRWFWPGPVRSWVTMQRPSRPSGARICRSPQRGSRPELAVPGAALCGAPSGLRQRQVVPELPAGADVELGEHLAQVVLDGARADEQPGADLRVRGPSPASRAICASCAVSSSRVSACACARSRRWPAARGGRARRTPPPPSR